ncbi:MAG: hypothetical protein IJZ40_02260 [Bacteroidaceae bacterium]|nr:hypothetical protein [Bacteroidaceae bacterium]
MNIRERINELLSDDCKVDTSQFSITELKRVLDYVEDSEGRQIKELSYFDTTQITKSLSVKIIKDDGSESGCTFLD